MKKYVLFLLCLFLSVKVTFCLTKSDIRTQARYLLLDKSTDTTKQTWTDSMLNTRIEMAQIEIARKTLCLERTTYYTTYMSTRGYALPSDLLLINRVAYYVLKTTNVYQRITRWTLAGIDEDNNYWQQLADGQPQKYYLWASSINIVPAPNSSYAGESRLQIDYFKIPDTLSSDTSIPFDGEYRLYPYHPLLIYYVVAWCKRDLRLFDEANYYEQQFYNLMSLMMNEISQKPDWFPDFSIRDYKR